MRFIDDVNQIGVGFFFPSSMQITASGGRLCQALKSVVVATKGAAQNYPSVSATQEMVDRVAELSQQAAGFSTLLQRLAEISSWYSVFSLTWLGVVYTTRRSFFPLWDALFCHLTLTILVGCRGAHSNPGMSVQLLLSWVLTVGSAPLLTPSPHLSVGLPLCVNLLNIWCPVVALIVFCLFLQLCFIVFWHIPSLHMIATVPSLYLFNHPPSVPKIA